MKKIFAFGDSIMKGVVTNPVSLGENIKKYSISVNNFVACCERHFGISILNHSRFGSTITGGRRCIERHFGNIAEGDIVVLEFGGNDCNFDWKAISEHPEYEHNPLTSLQLFKDTYILIIEKLKSVGAIPILLSLPVIEKRKFFNHISQGLSRINIMRWLGGDLQQICDWHEQYNLAVFSIANQTQVPVIDISTIFLSRKDSANLYCEDGMHPNETGHKMIADEIINYIESHTQSINSSRISEVQNNLSMMLSHA